MQFKPTNVTISGTFIVLIGYFAGKAWSNVLPRGDKLEASWREKNNQGDLPAWIRFFKFINPGPWGLKEHAICSITATSASNAAASIQVFAAQDLFYDLPLSATTVVLTVISIGLFGYGICGVMRPIAVWHVDAVYWGTLPTVKTLQGLHWQDLKNSKPLRWFWYSFAGMFVYEFFPAYIFPWLNSVSIPCLAAMNATGSKAAVLTNLFGGSINNEGLGLFTVSLDWQYVSHTSIQEADGADFETHYADHFFHYLSSSYSPSSFGCRVFHLLPCYAWYLLHKCLGCKVAALHVDTASIRGWFNISYCQGLYWGRSQSRSPCKIRHPQTHRKFRVCHVHG